MLLLHIFIIVDVVNYLPSHFTIPTTSHTAEMMHTVNPYI